MYIMGSLLTLINILDIDVSKEKLGAGTLILGLMSLAYIILLLTFMTTNSKRGANQYGPDPKDRK